jgi:hypothetical protein
MATKRQIAANRKNARRSTGPRTDAGKERSSMNSTKHGLLGEFHLIEGEDPREFSNFADRARADMKPEGEVEEFYVRQWIEDAWRIDRIDNTLSVTLVNRGSLDDLSTINLFKIYKYVHDGLIRLFDKLPDISRVSIESESYVQALAENNFVWRLIGESESASAEQLAIIPDEWSCLETIYISYLIDRLCKSESATNAQSTRIPSETDRAEVERSNRSARDAIKMMAWAFAGNRMQVALALRYRSQLERSRNNALHELQRLQAARRGLVVAAAEVVDVNVSFERQTRNCETNPILADKR